MTESLKYIDRQTGRECIEQVYGGKLLCFLYGRKWTSRLIGRPLVFLSSRIPFISSLYGWWQKRSWTKRKIAPFIKRFDIDVSEFRCPVKNFRSFNDFFTRELREECRPIAPEDNVAIIPADGRYRFIPNIADADGFLVKGRKFSLKELLGSEKMAEEYAQGSMVMARLCPVDYHRFHFPCQGTPGFPKPIKGQLYSVNPIALKQNIRIFTQNKRIVTTIETSAFGRIAYVEVGAANVGTIHETFTPETLCRKGQEKGYFSFGGSALLLLFPPGSIHFDEDLLRHSCTGMEVLCHMGQSMGQSR